MRLQARLSRFALLLLAAALWPPAARAQDAAREVEGLERELVAAIGRGDMAAYDRIVADGYVAFEASGKASSKAEIMTSYRTGTRHYTNLEIFDVTGRVYGDAAVVSAKTKGLRKEGDRDVPNRVHYIRVFSRRDGRWRAVTQMSAPIPEAAGTDETKR